MPLKSWLSLGGGLLLSAILVWRLMWLSRDVMKGPDMGEKIEPKTDPPTPIIPTPDPMPRQPIVPKPNGGKPSK